jgi:hypothetical protein
MSGCSTEHISSREPLLARRCYDTSLLTGGKLTPPLTSRWLTSKYLYLMSDSPPKNPLFPLGNAAAALHYDDTGNADAQDCLSR